MSVVTPTFIIEPFFILPKGKFNRAMLNYEKDSRRADAFVRSARAIGSTISLPEGSGAAVCGAIKETACLQTQQRLCIYSASCLLYVKISALCKDVKNIEDIAEHRYVSSMMLE